MTMFAVFWMNIDAATPVLPAAMFKEKEVANAWGKEKYGTAYKIKELEITRCDVVERTGLVGR